ncbi:sigma-70 family RNA polymerase sigma factor [Paracidovorax valerianellae]|uniref:RNA polymerase sigma-70 factor, ECF subfamily n=1 Tax=Paracidovorax valerianellae TaxID=187868 RepID=A0A1G6TV98_9BURK|nr:sigma-70 family RNA polymerase sigma factor [Paracidovorax valerianellae]MDA8446928.1 sigma-70 family RNA polymerase sigma factor [Paracidovorax valerianellae]SDD32235.1 RNA polymerase sigma-70 factor, ECF subfamily [Paracidovorax valerianellae]
MSVVDTAVQLQMHALYCEHHGWLFGWLRRRLGCGHHAADVAQDTFVRILGSRDALLAMREPRAYLVTTAKRLLIDETRRQSIEKAYLEALTAEATSHQVAPSAEEVAQTVQALMQIEAALDGLSAKARQAFLLCYLEGHTHAVAAGELGVSTKMVQKYLVQALAYCHRSVQG